MVNLWAFDSHEDRCLGLKGWGCVDPNARKYFEDENKNKPNLAFMHIPMQEYLDLSRGSQTFGHYFDVVSCSTINTGLFSSLYRENTKAVFCGHNHNNDFIGDYLGISLAFGRKTGYGGYGPCPGLQRGARIIELEWLDGELKINTWIRQEDGTIDN